MSSKFTDSPYFILEEFFNNLIPYGHVYPTKASLRGMGCNISAVGGFGVELYLKNNNPTITADWTNPYRQYYRIKARNHTLSSRDTATSLLNDTFFTFNFEPPTIFKGSEMTYTQLSDYANTAESSPVEVYFRKDHLIKDFVDADTDYDGFVNTNKTFIYFGELFTTGDNTFIVDFNHMMKYAINALPVNNRTDNLNIFFENYFDKLYSQTYNKLKNITVQSDPFEMDSNYLYYLLNMFKTSSNHNMTDEIQREFISNLPFLLKRKGSYASLYIIWKMLMLNTSNLLNIYERWHPWIITGTPLENFTDYLYTSYSYYRTSPPSNTGAGPGYYYADAATSEVTIEASLSTWDVIHNLNNLYVLTQFVNENDKLIIPSEIIYIDSNNLTASFGTPIKGTAICTEAASVSWEYTHTQVLPGTIWTVSHALNQQYPMLQVISNNKVIYPNTVYYDDVNTMTITFDTAIEGIARVFTSDDLIIEVESVTGTTWTIDHELGDQYPVVQIINDSDYMQIPDSITFTDTSSLTIGFTESVTGRALLFSNLFNIYYPTYSPSVSADCMTPHYRVEIDLSNEPMKDDIIIDSTIWDDLTTYWEEVRPVCKYAHYSEIISPITDFTGYSTPLYDGSSDNRGYVNSKCCDPILSANSNCFVYSNLSNSSTWIIYHTLATKNLTVQCFNLNKYQIYPSNIVFQSDDVIVITFDSAVNGYAFISKADYTHDQAVGAVSWAITHSLSDQYLINLARDETTDTEFVPLSITMTDANSSVVVLASANSGHVALTKKATGMATPYSRLVVSDTWTIFHNLNASAIQVQVFDTKDVVIMPSSVYINDNNTCTLTFDTPVAGKAVVKDIGLDDSTMTSWMSTFDTIKVGSAGGPDWNPVVNNDIETSLGTYDYDLFEEDDSYYYVQLNISDATVMTITEIGLFDNGGDIMFYTYMSPIYKPANVEFILWYRIKKITR